MGLIQNLKVDSYTCYLGRKYRVQRPTAKQSFKTYLDKMNPDLPTKLDLPDDEIPSQPESAHTGYLAPRENPSIPDRIGSLPLVNGKRGVPITTNRSQPNNIPNNRVNNIPVNKNPVNKQIQIQKTPFNNIPVNIIPSNNIPLPQNHGNLINHLPPNNIRPTKTIFPPTVIPPTIIPPTIIPTTNILPTNTPPTNIPTNNIPANTTSPNQQPTIKKSTSERYEPPATKKEYKCEYPPCQWSFDRPKELIRHHLTHSKDKPFKCNYCDYSCNRRDNLRTHERKHTKITPYQCCYVINGQRCPREFKRSDERLNHHKVHENNIRLGNLKNAFYHEQLKSTDTKHSDYVQDNLIGLHLVRKSVQKQKTDRILQSQQLQHQLQKNRLLQHQVLQQMQRSGIIVNPLLFANQLKK